MYKEVLAIDKHLTKSANLTNTKQVKPKWKYLFMMHKNLLICFTEKKVKKKKA